MDGHTADASCERREDVRRWTRGSWRAYLVGEVFHLGAHLLDLVNLPLHVLLSPHQLTFLLPQLLLAPPIPSAILPTKENDNAPDLTTAHRKLEMFFVGCARACCDVKDPAGAARTSTSGARCVSHSAASATSACTRRTRRSLKRHGLNPLANDAGHIPTDLRWIWVSSEL